MDIEALDPDSEALNTRWGFDVAAAMEKYTFENPRHPGSDEERLFECWRCACLQPSWHFKGMYDHRCTCNDRELTSVYAVLGRIVVGGSMGACVECEQELSDRPARPPRPRRSTMNAMVRSFSERRWNQDGPYSGRWMLEAQVKVNGHPTGSVTFRQVGFLKPLYMTKQAAADAYNAGNPHLRAIRKESQWRSDWDPETGLRFIVRKRENVERTIAPPWE